MIPNHFAIFKTMKEFEKLGHAYFCAKCGCSESIQITTFELKQKIKTDRTDLFFCSKCSEIIKGKIFQKYLKKFQNIFKIFP